MNTAGRLGELYGLSPATMAGLANITGDAANDAPAPQVINAAPVVIGEEPSATTTDNIRTGIANAYDVPAAVQWARGKLASPGERPAGVTEVTTPRAPPETPEDAAIRQANERDQDTARQLVQQNQAGRGGGVVPAHMEPGTHAVALQHAMDPGELATGEYNRDVAMGQGLLAADKHLEAAQKAGEADAVYAKAHVLASQQAGDRIAEINRQRDAYVATETKKLEELSTRAQQEVDPDQYWKSKGSGARVTAALTIGLNEFAVLWRGRGTNTAKAIIDEAVRDNIDAQKANVSNARNALAGRESVYARNLATFGDQERATLATKMQYLDQVAAMADAQRVSAKSDEAEAGYHQLVQQLYGERAGYADQFAKLTHTQVSEQMNEHYVRAQALGGAQTIGEKGKEDLFVPDLGGYARTKEEAVKIRDHSARTQVIVGALEKAKKIYESAEKTRDPIELYKLQQALESLKAQAAVQRTVMEGQGAMSKGDQAVSDAANGLLDGSVYRLNPQLKLQAGLADKAIASAQQEHGRLGTNLQRGAEVYVKDKNGNYVPRSVLFGRNAPQRNMTDNVEDKMQPPVGRTGTDE